MVDDEANFNPTKDLEELERLLAKEPQSNFTEIQVHSVIINIEPFLHTQLMNPLYGVFKTSKPCKVDREILSPRSQHQFRQHPESTHSCSEETLAALIIRDDGISSDTLTKYLNAHTTFQPTIHSATTQ
ncbi:hypothetical protein Tco_0889100 [Tanacetum coccineum]